MRAILLKAAGADVPAPSAPEGGVFQYLGALDRPGEIGLARGDGSRILFDLYEQAVWTSESDSWTPYAELAPGSAERRAADRLIDRWARERWLRHLRGG
jgi:hypothetical protein